MTTTPRTVRDEILAAAEEHGWTETSRKRVVVLAKNSRTVIVGFTMDGDLASARIGDWDLMSSRLARVLAELAR
jgi:hypothetical protein